jgi:hypothetical protein
MTVEFFAQGASEVRAKLEALPGNLRTALRNTINASIIDMEGQVKDKLSGPVLRNRTGRLRNSINALLTETETNITGSVGANMDMARYAAAQEYGFQGTVSVRAHLRTITQAFGITLKDGPKTINVREHPMRMNLPERSYLRSTLAENAASIIERLSQATSEAISA